MSEGLLQVLENRSWVLETFQIGDAEVDLWLRKITGIEYLDVVGCAFASFPEPPPAPMTEKQKLQQPVPDDTPVTKAEQLNTAHRRLKIAQDIVRLGVVDNAGSFTSVLTEQTVGQLKDTELNDIANALMTLSGLGQEDQAAAEHFQDESE